MPIKKILKWFLIIFLTLAVLLGLFIANMIFRVDVYVFPINAHISKNVVKWGDQVELIPDIFAIGDAYEDVKSSLSFSGYSYIPPDKVWPKYKEYKKPGYYVFTREASAFPCNVKLYVFLKFDENMRLVEAIATKHEHGCL